MPLQGADIEADLAARDFTVNAMAEPLAGGSVLDPFGGRGRPRRRGGCARSAPGAFDADPLRTLRAVRFAAELGFEIEPTTAAGAARTPAGSPGSPPSGCGPSCVA